MKKRFVIKTKIEDGGVLGFGKKLASPADYDGKQRQEISFDIASLFLQKGIDSGQFADGSNYKIVSSSFTTGLMTVTVEVL